MSSDAWLPLIGVVLGGGLGAGTTYLVDRSRWNRENEESQRRTQMAAYTTFAVAAKDTMLLLYRVAADLGWDDQTDPLPLVEARPLLSANLHQRDRAFERVVMIGDAEVVQTARNWVPSIYALRAAVRSGIGDRVTWQALVATANDGRVQFERRAREAAL